jgi:hypothetical protein
MGGPAGKRGAALRSGAIDARDDAGLDAARGAGGDEGRERNWGCGAGRCWSRCSGKGFDSGTGGVPNALFATDFAAGCETGGSIGLGRCCLASGSGAAAEAVWTGGVGSTPVMSGNPRLARILNAGLVP